jgi:transitional endoplasmic reticulum ATPase
MPNILKKDDIINDTYTVHCHIGQGAFGDVYRVRHKFLGLQVLKVFKDEYVVQADIETITREAKLLSRLTYPNIVRVYETNTFERQGQTHYFITMGFVSGETLTSLLVRETALELPLALSLIQDILTGLAVVHGHAPPIVHRDISPDNILLSYAEEKPLAMLSDFGLAQFSDHSQRLARAAGKYVYMAPECFWDVHLPCSDVFSAALVIYRMLTGRHPWEYDLDGLEDHDDILAAVGKARRKSPLTPAEQHVHLPGTLEDALMKALTLDMEERFLNAVGFLNALNPLFGSSQTSLAAMPSDSPEPEVGSGAAVLADKPFKVRVKGKGFDQIAGMDDLKELLYHDVIRPLQEKELYARYRLTIPNGMLLYGPPGCGKTFIAQKFAEEVGFTFLSIKPSDVASIYVHGTQEKIRAIFEKARTEAPSIIFIDEVDALMPSRAGDLQHSYSSEVNEFLVQMSDCGKDNVFLIAATNRPDKIDPAILRTGRLDKLFYLSPPDALARQKMFQLHLSGRPTDEIDLEELAMSTVYYVASDITFLVNEAARQALKERGPLRQEHIQVAIKSHRPSVSPRQLTFYEKFRDERSFD